MTVLGVHLWRTSGSQRVGTARTSHRRGSLTTVFDYDREYLAGPRSWAIGPDLPIRAGRGVTEGLPGAFTDCAPDRWGRQLIARHLGTHRARPLTDVDYLLGVSDHTRQGALRFSLDGAGQGDRDYLATGTQVPPLIELPRLLQAAHAVVTSSGDDLAAVKVLLDAGTGSLGGARPKATIRQGDRLSIAKFPHPGDQWNVMAWEKTALDLAERSGIAVPRRRLISVGRASVLLLDRFDRVGQARVPYVSAMSLVQAHDGESHDYLEVAEALTEHGHTVRDDLKRLWQRMAFSVAINNTDDHLRNHGFVHRQGGWTLAPAFDLNPNPDPRATRTTSIGFTSTRDESEAALDDVAPSFGVEQAEGDSLRQQIRDAVSGWRSVADHNGVPVAEQNWFADVLG